MSVPAPAQVRGYLTGIVEMARGEAQGLNKLDLSTGGFWRSFWALLYSLPAYLFFWFADRRSYLIDNPDAEAGAAYLARAALSDLIGIAASLGAIALLAKPLNMTDRFAQWVISANWLSLPVSYLSALVVMLTINLALPDGMTFLTMMILLVAVLVISYRVYKVALKGDGMLAFGIIVITHIIAVMSVLALG
ncbi:MAG: hypothetical protein NXI27_15085 [Alphaproteobacteria bacterium]|nr:hypothetical protein [Alphaproteobacteria bacterium]